MGVVSTSTPLIAKRCPAHGTFRARSEERCPACPPIATEPEVLMLPGESDDFPSDEEHGEEF